MDRIINCVKCKRDKKHYAKGLCTACYKTINLNKDKHKERLKRWKYKHPDYFKDYYQMHKQIKMENKYE